MSEDYPRDHKDYEHKVAEGLKAAVFQDLGSGEEHVDDVHEQEDDVPDFGEVVAVGACAQETRNDVVGDHL